MLINTMMDASFGDFRFKTKKSQRKKGSSAGVSPALNTKPSCADVSCLICKQKMRKHRSICQLLSKMLN